MPKLRVGVLYDSWSNGDDDDGEEKAARGKRRRRKEDHEEIHEALKKKGHEAFYHVLDGTRSPSCARTSISISRSRTPATTPRR